MKKLLSIVLTLAMILSTIIIPSAVIVSAEDVASVEVLTATYYVSAEGNDETGDGTAENPFATIAKAETVAASLEDEDTIVNATIMISGELSYAADVAHKGMFTIQGDGTESSVLSVVSGTSFGPTGVYGSLLSGPVTVKDLVYNAASGNHIVTNGNELVVDLAAFNAPKTNTFHIMNVDGKDEKVTVNAYKSQSWIASAFNVGSTKGAMGGLDFVYNSGRMRHITFAATTFNGNVNLTFNGVNKRSDEGLDINVTEGAVFNKAVQVIFNNKTGATFTSNALANVNAAEGVWVMNGLSTAGTLTTTETVGTFAVNSTAVAQAQNKATGEVYFAENGYLTVPAGVYDFSFGGPSELYVSATGSDETGDGTVENPYATINKATEIMANNVAGTIYVSGNITTGLKPAAHVGMLTIQGVEGTTPIVRYNANMNPNGPLTIKDVAITPRGNHPITSGHEFILDVAMTTTDASSAVKYKIGNKNNTETSYTNEKMTVINNTKGGNGHPSQFLLGGDNFTYTGGIDFVHQAGFIRNITIANSTFKGNVNITVDSFTQRTDDAAQAYQEVFTDGAVLEKALQVIYNNNSAANIKSTKVFETDAVTAQGGKWVIYGDNSGGKLRTTDTAGTFKVVGPATAIATNAEGTEVLSENGLLTLPAGVWNVTYDYRVVYVSETGSDETGDGTEANPYATLKKAMPLLGNKTGTIYIMGNVLSADVAHTGMITLKGYDENSNLTINGSWKNQIYESWTLQGPTTLEDLRITFTHKLVTQGQKLVIKNCWTAGNCQIRVGHYQQNTHTTANELIIDGLAFKNANNVADSAPWNGLSIYLGSYGDSTSYNTNDINISVKNTNLKAIRMEECKGTIKGDVKIEVDNSVLLCTDGAYFTSIDDTAIDGNFEFISNGKGTAAYTGITPADTDLTHVAVTEGNEIWFINSGAGDKLEATEVAGTYNVLGGMIATATNTNGDTVKSVDGVLTLPAGTWDISYDMTDFYVSETGDDTTGDGTKDKPFLSVDKALASIGDKEGATIYVSGTVTLRYDTAHSNMVTITGVNGTADVVKAGYGNTANAGISNPFKGPITFKDISLGGNGQYWITNGYDVVYDNTPVVSKNNTTYIGNAEATQRDENVVINNAGTKSFAQNFYFGIFGSAAKTGAVNFVYNGGTFQQLRFVNGIFAGDVNITINSFTPRANDGEWNLLVDTVPTFEKALQVIFNNNTYTAKLPKSDAWSALTANGGKWIIKGAAGGTLSTTDVAGKFAVTTNEANYSALAYDESGKMVAKSENGILDLSAAEGIYTVSYVDASTLLDAIYVSADGSDTNVGSEDAPVATLKVAIEKAKALATEEKVIYIMGTVDTLVNGKSDYVTYDEMITFKGYNADSTLNIVGVWSNQINTVYRLQGPTTFEGLRITHSVEGIITNGNELTINDCYTNQRMTFYVADFEKYIEGAKVNKLTVNNFEFFNATFTGEAPWLGVNVYYGAFGGDANQVASGAAANFATGGVEVNINNTNLQCFRFDRSRGYIAGDVKLTVNDAFIVPSSQGGYSTSIGSVNAETGELTQSAAIKGAVMVAVNNNIGTNVALGTNGYAGNLTKISADKGAYFVYSADINGNTMAIGDEAGKFDINSPYSVDVRDAEGNVVTRASDVLTVEAGTYFVGYFNAADINGDGKLDIRDLVAFKNEFAKAEVKNYPQFDISFDGAVDTNDLASLQKYFLNITEIKFAPVGDDLAFTYFEDIGLTSDEMAEDYKSVIYAEDDSNVPEGVETYYVSSLDANSQNLGTKAHPFTSIEALNAAFAEKVVDKSTIEQAVLFERGSVFRTTEELILDSYTYYGAYGEGAKPQILGSRRDYADASLWTTENGGSIWQLQVEAVEDTERTAKSLDYAANIVVTKDGVEGIAVRRTSLANVDSTGEYYYDKATGIVYLYCDFINPANYFDTIEISGTNILVRNYSIDSENRVNNNNITFENIALKYAGIHGMALTNLKNSTIANCEIGWIGGHFSSGDQRYGNGIEMWNNASNVTVVNNHIYQNYDAAVTYQGSASNQYENIIIENNLIERCSFGFEFWAGAGVDLISVPKLDAQVTEALINAIAAAGIEVELQVGDVVTQELIDVIEAKNVELQAQIDDVLADAVMDEIYFQYNVMRLAAGGMGGACRPYSNYQSFIQPFNMDASKLGTFNVNILENVFDTSYRSFVWGTAGTTEEDPIGPTISAMYFEGNYYLQTGPAPSLVNGVECPTFADFEEAVYALDENAALVDWS